jgi:molybdopterin converting factor subunit 1
MIVKILLFAQAKEVVGTATLDLVLDDDANVGAMKQTLVEQYPALLNVLNQSLISVEREYADDHRQLYHGAEVGVIPPVGGG